MGRNDNQAKIQLVVLVLGNSQHHSPKQNLKLVKLPDDVVNCRSPVEVIECLQLGQSWY